MNRFIGEQWKPIPGWERFYEASTHGRIRSLPRMVPHWRGGEAFRPGRIMAPHLDKDGYPTVQLSRLQKRVLCKAHRLVALTFLTDRTPGRAWVLHRDGDPKNNSVANLYWGDQADNERDKLRHGTHQEKRKTHCPQGHPYSTENTYVPPGTEYRQCRTCRAAYVARRNRDRKKGLPMKQLSVILAALILTVLAPTAHASSEPTYDLDHQGLSLLGAEVFEAHSHVNVRYLSGGVEKTKNIHLDPHNDQPGGHWIGRSFIPWSAFADDIDCIVWTQVHGHDYHYGAQGEDPLCLGKPPTEPPSEDETRERVTEIDCHERVTYWVQERREAIFDYDWTVPGWVITDWTDWELVGEGFDNGVDRDCDELPDTGTGLVLAWVVLGACLVVAGGLALLAGRRRTA